jgi:DNA polymerase (family 10)
VQNQIKVRLGDAERGSGGLWHKPPPVPYNILGMTNQEIAAVLARIGVYRELKGDNPFKALAFERAARVVERHPESLQTLVAEDRLSGIQGIGSSIAEVIRELVRTGKSAALEALKADFPPGLEEVLGLPGLGPKRVRLLWQKLGVSSLGELEYACRENRLLGLEGFGVKSQEKILKAIDFQKRFRGLFLYSEAEAIAAEAIGELEGTGLFRALHRAGSLRRGKRVLKDVDILAIPKPRSAPDKVKAALVGLADSADSVSAEGDTKVSIRRKGLAIDFRLLAPESEAPALQHFTGSKEHNTLLRGRAKGLGLKMNEYGVFRGEEALRLAGEEEVYRAIGLPWIPPELREGERELEAAEAGRLPRLVERSGLRGLIHAHSRWSDGQASIEELALECRRLGYGWLALSDHSRSAVYAGGLSAERLAEQRAEVEKLNRRLAPFRIFCGVESDILADGGLDYPQEVLDGLDFVIGSVHSGLNMSREQATERLAAAAANPAFSILGHVSGELLLSRDGYPFDEDRLFAGLAQAGAALEHNCHPARLDPDWPVLQRAARRGIRIALGPDAHSLADLDFVRYGLLFARKAWLEPGQLLNCLSAEEADAWFTSRRKKTRR